MKISVIIPVFNVEKYLEECLDSVINQTLKDIEIICVNDGSIDHSPEILDEYSKKDSRITIFEQKNKGQSAARNRGLEHARGEYIYFVDSDDYLEIDALEILYKTMKMKNLDILYFDAKSFFEATHLEEKFNGQEYYYRDQEYAGVYSGQRLFQLMKQNNEYRVSPCLQMIKHSFLKENGIKFFEGIIYEDNLFTLLTILQAKKVSHLNKPFYKRRWHQNSTTGKTITFKNVYGYFTVYIQMLNFSIAHPEFESETQKWIVNELKRILQCVRAYYRNLTIDEKDAISDMNEHEQYLFVLLVLEPIKNSMRNTTKPLVRFFQKIKNGIKYYREHGMRNTLSKVYDQFKR